jgi:hypothetical protein
LFNVRRYDGLNSAIPGLGLVPVLAEGTFADWLIDSALRHLRSEGSQAAPGFGRPEGIVVYHTAANSTFKVLLDGDDRPKSAVVAGSGGSPTLNLSVHPEKLADARFLEAVQRSFDRVERVVA